MPKVEYGSFTITSTGPDTIILNDDTIDITDVVLFVANSSSEVSAGHSDGTTQFTGGSAYGDENASHVLTHYRNISGTKTKVLETATTNLDVGEFSIDTTTLTATTQVRYVVLGN
jgi:hypothetical protein